MDTSNFRETRRNPPQVRLAATVTAASLLVIALSGCVEQSLGDLEPADESTLDKLRVLAIQSEPPDLLANESATLRALVFSPNETELQYDWTWCPARASGTEGFDCAFDEEQLAELWSELELPGELPPFNLGDTPEVEFLNPFSAEAVLALCAALSGGQDVEALQVSCVEGFQISIRLDVSRGEDTRIALKDLSLLPASTSDEDRNQNPGPLGDVEIFEYFEDEPIDGKPLELDGVYTIRFDLDEELSQEFTETSLFGEKNPETTSEALVMSWFTTLGAPDEFPDTQEDRDELENNPVPPEDPDRSVYVPGSSDFDLFGQGIWILPQKSNATEGTLIAVLRDDRGGVSWAEVNVAIEGRN